MGLMYVFPVTTEEADFVDIKGTSVTVKSYGLPYIFWGYAFAALVVIFFMFLAIKAPVLKLVELGDETDATLGYALLSFIGCLPVFILAFFFYEKRIINTPLKLTMEYRIFGIKVFSETFTHARENSLFIESFLSSPNVARIKEAEGTAGFQNKGYYVLWLRTDDDKKFLVDRHSRKADLVKLQALLEGKI